MKAAFLIAAALALSVDGAVIVKTEVETAQLSFTPPVQILPPPAQPTPPAVLPPPQPTPPIVLPPPIVFPPSPKPPTYDTKHDYHHKPKPTKCAKDDYEEHSDYDDNYDDHYEDNYEPDNYEDDYHSVRPHITKRDLIPPGGHYGRIDGHDEFKWFFLYGNNYFLTSEVPRRWAGLACAHQGGRLAELSASEVRYIGRGLYHLGVKHPVWIRSYNGDSYKGAPIALYPGKKGGAVAVPPHAKYIKLHALCEKNKHYDLDGY